MEGRGDDNETTMKGELDKKAFITEEDFTFMIEDINCMY